MLSKRSGQTQDNVATDGVMRDNSISLFLIGSKAVSFPSVSDVNTIISILLAHN